MLGAILAPFVGTAQAVPGHVDVTFGRGGKVITKFGGSGDARAITLQPDGKLVVAGWAETTTTTFALARYASRGKLDRSFGKGGIVRTAVGQSSSAWAMAIQPDGRIVLAGGSSNGTTNDVALARYRRNGSLDPTFGHGGKVTTSLGGSVALAAVLQPDGKIVIGGGAGRQFVLARYRRNGSLDLSFGTKGTASVSFEPLSSHVNGLALQPDGKIVAVGSAFEHEHSEMAIARFNRSGSIDTSFGVNGKTVLFSNVLSTNEAAAARVQRNGKLLIVGITQGGFTLLQLKADGSLDRGFGENGDGTTVTPYAAGAGGYGLAIQRDGRIVVAGGALKRNGMWNFGVARYTRRGFLDESFGSGGAVATRLSSGQDLAHGVVIQRNGKIVVAGGAKEYDGGFALVRYLGSPKKSG